MSSASREPGVWKPILLPTVLTVDIANLASILGPDFKPVLHWTQSQVMCMQVHDVCCLYCANPVCSWLCGTSFRASLWQYVYGHGIGCHPRVTLPTTLSVKAVLPWPILLIRLSCMHSYWQEHPPHMQRVAGTCASMAPAWWSVADCRSCSGFAYVIR